MLTSRRLRTTAVATAVAASSLLGVAVSASTASAADATAHRSYPRASVSWYEHGDKLVVKDTKRDGLYPLVFVKDLTAKKSWGWLGTRHHKGATRSYSKIPEGHRVQLHVSMRGTDSGKHHFWYKALRTHA
ncbi:hypothetical protein ACTWJ8_40435 (plasmid) [Streptomyces sp. SDT5-1]|uniref:hypothetical protein n=1 Tax=Streptomyces sp. SDT5-1 TaxID=3406418 RepID=UPI003FD28F1C